MVSIDSPEGDASRTTDGVLLAGLELLAARDASEQVRYAELRREIEVGLAEADRGELMMEQKFSAGYSGNCSNNAR